LQGVLAPIFPCAASPRILCFEMAPCGDSDDDGCGNNHNDRQSAASRPASHVGLGNELPPLRPCQDARTPLERLSSPATLSQERSGVGGDEDGPRDILQRLRALQQSEIASSLSSSARHWGEQERLARDLMEDVCGGNAPDAAEDLMDALTQVCPSAVDADGFALLHYASMYGNLDAVASLVRAKANLNCRTSVHETPLALAACYRHAEACALLLAHQARPDLADWRGRTPLATAKSSKCGNGRDNNLQAQARCVELLEQRAARDHASGSSREAEDLREQGNDAFRKGKHSEAAAAYSLGLSFVDDAALYANRAACYLALGKYVEAKMDAQKAVGLSGDGGHRKASWRLAKATLALGELDRAEEALREALARDPGDAALRQLRVEVERERRKRLGV